MAGGGHGFGDGGGEGDDVVLDFALDFGDAGDVEAGVGAEQAGGLGGDHAEFGQRFGSGQLDFEPLLEFVLVAPDAAHFGAGVSGNHNLSVLFRGGAVLSWGSIFNAETRRRGDFAEELGLLRGASAPSASPR